MSTGVDMKHVPMPTEVSKKIGKVIRSGVTSTELAIQRKTEAPALHLSGFTSVLLDPKK